ncbi:hypothetical protein F2P79_010443 [Pimephales promelas]|nr:hypothetical protein F2P79_010443 [Pimephales promelas]
MWQIAVICFAACGVVRAERISDSGRAALVFAEREREISPIPAGEMSSSRDFTHTHISPSSPRMKSTTRHSCSPPKLQDIRSSSSQESSPQPEKITLHDLTDPLQLVSTDQECFLERLQDHHQGECSSSSSSPSSSSPAATRDRPEEEEQRWEEERKSKEEREEAQEREMERLEQETEEQNEKPAEDEREGHVTLPTSAIGGGGADVANPLQKYMMMVMQDQSPKKEASEHQSEEDVLPSERDEHSAGVTSHTEPDDDFW